jgi:hypothetical protein
MFGRDARNRPCLGEASVDCRETRLAHCNGFARVLTPDGGRSGHNYQILRSDHEHHQHHHQWVLSLVVVVVSVLQLPFQQYPFPSPSPEQPELNWRVLIATCKQLVWSIRIGRNMSIWVLCLILGSGPGADLPLEVTGPCLRTIGTWSPRSSAYRPFACQVSTSRRSEPTPLTAYRAVPQVPPPLCRGMVERANRFCFKAWKCRATVSTLNFTRFTTLYDCKFVQGESNLTKTKTGTTKAHFTPFTAVSVENCLPITLRQTIPLLEADIFVYQFYRSCLPWNDRSPDRVLKVVSYSLLKLFITKFLIVKTPRTSSYEFFGHSVLRVEYGLITKTPTHSLS